MSRLLACLIPILLLAPLALEAQAPLQPEPIVAWVEWEPAAVQHPDVWSADPSRVAALDVARTVGGGTLGGLVGLGATALFISQTRSWDGAYFAGMAAGMVLIPAGAALGAHISNSSRGRLGTVLLATGGAAVGSTLLAAGTGGLLVIVIPVSIIGVGAATELLTTR